MLPSHARVQDKCNAWTACARCLRKALLGPAMHGVLMIAACLYLPGIDTSRRENVQKKKSPMSHYNFFSQLRADQMSAPPREGQLCAHVYTLSKHASIK